MQHVLPLLIERAQAARDQRARLAREAELALAQARLTQTQLEDFRGSCLARSPGMQGGSTDSAMLQTHQTFVLRLDDVIQLQRDEQLRRSARADTARESLQESQRRVLALEALGRRLADRRQAKTTRAAQRDADEHALRQAIQNLKDATP